MFYTGVGSRTTPGAILDLMTRAAHHLALLGYTLRSGHAHGADQAFERGAGGYAELYLPWPAFASDTPLRGVVQSSPARQAMPIAALHHPAWGRLDDPARLLHARNVHQVLGRDLNCPSKFLICFTPGGTGSGGTGQAIRIARAYSVPVFDLGDPVNQRRIQAMLDAAH